MSQIWLPERLRGKLLKSENKTGEDMGDHKPAIRSDAEDLVIEALDWCHRMNSPEPFRQALDKQLRAIYAQRLGNKIQLFVDAVRYNDEVAWIVIHSLTCSLRRMAPYYEHSANWLLGRGIRPDAGYGYLADQDLS